jgi:hypothetical protein
MCDVLPPPILGDFAWCIHSWHVSVSSVRLNVNDHFHFQSLLSCGMIPRGRGVFPYDCGLSYVVVVAELGGTAKPVLGNAMNAKARFCV